MNNNPRIIFKTKNEKERNVVIPLLKKRGFYGAIDISMGTYLEVYFYIFQDKHVYYSTMKVMDSKNYFDSIGKFLSNFKRIIDGHSN